MRVVGLLHLSKLVTLLCTCATYTLQYQLQATIEPMLLAFTQFSFISQAISVNLLASPVNQAIENFSFILALTCTCHSSCLLFFRSILLHNSSHGIGVQKLAPAMLLAFDEIPFTIIAAFENRLTITMTFASVLFTLVTRSDHPSAYVLLPSRISPPRKFPSASAFPTLQNRLPISVGSNSC